MSDTVERYQEAFDRLAPALPGRGVAWLEGARRDAFRRFRELGFPTTRDEDWKYTRVTGIEKHPFAAATETTDTPDLGGLLLPDDARAHQLVFLDGILREDLGRTGTLPCGVRVSALAGALVDGDPTLEPFIAGPELGHGFLALNTAFIHQGVVVDLDRDVTLDGPLHLLFLASGKRDSIAHPRIVIRCGPRSRVTVIEHYASLGDSAYFNNVVTQASLAGGSSLTHYKLQRESTSAFHVSTLSVRQQTESRFQSHSVSLGAAIARHDINVSLDAPGASCGLNGLYLGRARQHVDYHTRVDHTKPECTSDEDYRGILDGRARGVFNGRVYVHPDAQKTDARQSNRNLLLSRNAEVDTKPQLEIHADDVKCAHGATVGQLDERMVFYLRSRGLGEAAARALLTYGFARDLVDRMEIAAVREQTAGALLERMPSAQELKDILQ
jgi:Fe-S cluster assembly protein SufD